MVGEQVPVSSGRGRGSAAGRSMGAPGQMGQVGAGSSRSSCQADGEPGTCEQALPPQKWLIVIQQLRVQTQELCQ